MKKGYPFWPIVLTPVVLSIFAFSLGHQRGLSRGYGSDAAHDETLDMLMQCADDLEQSASEVHTLAVSCVEACRGCPDVCERKCEERCDD